MKKAIAIDESKLPEGMRHFKLREDVAEIIYDWIHEQQVTHRRTYEQIPDNQKDSYRTVADRVIQRLLINKGETLNE